MRKIIICLFGLLAIEVSGAHDLTFISSFELDVTPVPATVESELPDGWQIESLLSGVTDDRGNPYVDKSGTTLIWAVDPDNTNHLIAKYFIGGIDSSVEFSASSTAVASILALPFFSGLSNSETERVRSLLKSDSLMQDLATRIQSVGYLDLDDDTHIEAIASIVAAILRGISTSSRELAAAGLANVSASELPDSIKITPDAINFHASSVVSEPIDDIDRATADLISASNEPLPVIGPIETRRMDAATASVSDDLVNSIISLFSTADLFPREITFDTPSPRAVRIFSGFTRSDFPTSIPTHWVEAADRAAASNVSQALVATVLNLLESSSASALIGQANLHRRCRQAISSSLSGAITSEVLEVALSGNSTTDLGSVLLSVAADIYSAALSECVIAGATNGWTSRLFGSVKTALLSIPGANAAIVFDDVSPALKIISSAIASPGIQSAIFFDEPECGASGAVDENLLQCFPDQALRACVGNFQGIAIADLTQLSCSFTGVSDLTGIENLSFLERLEVDWNQISDLAPLSALTELRELSIRENQIVDLTPLSGMTSLQRLAIDKNFISDISPLIPLTELSSLDIKQNSISDISPLGSLSNLVSLDIRHNSVSDISILANLPELGSFRADNNVITDVSVLADLFSLSVISFDSNSVSTISGWENLTQLDSLSADNNQISDISGLTGLTLLREVSLVENNIVDVSPLSSAARLDVLMLSGNQIVDLQGFANLSAIRILNLGNNEITDVTELQGLANLRYLDLGANEITDVSVLGNLVDLLGLNLRNNSIADAVPLSNLAALEQLDLAENELNSVIPLQSLAQLLFLNVGANSRDGSNTIPCDEMADLISALPSTSISGTQCWCDCPCGPEDRIAPRFCTTDSCGSSCPANLDTSKTLYQRLLAMSFN